jgi:hypothetical protein
MLHDYTVSGDQNMQNQKLLRYNKALSQYFPGRIDESLKILTSQS